MSAAREPRAHRFLSAPETRRFLTDYIRKRVAERDVDDVVQTVLVEALASDRMPEHETEMRKWLVGVARHKIADLHRRAGREQPAELADIEAAPPPVEERELARWAEEQAKGNQEAKKTLDWMAREGEGDKLEHIAEEEQVPAARVRQRVSRMRRFMKERWLAELAAVAALAVLAFIVYKVVSRPVDIAKDAPPEPAPTDRAPTPILPEPRVAEAKRVRDEALEKCRRDEHAACLEGLDRAKALDPAGDAAPEVQGARKTAEDALRPAPEPSVSSSASPDVTGMRPEQDLKPRYTPTSTPTNTPKAPPPTNPPSKKAPPSKGEKSSELGKESSFVPNDPATEQVMAPPASTTTSPEVVMGRQKPAPPAPQQAPSFTSQGSFEQKK